MNPIKYFLYFYHATKKRILVVIALVGLAAATQFLAISAMGAVVKFKDLEPEKNTPAMLLFSVFDFLGLTTSNQQLVFLFIFAGVMIIISATALVISSYYTAVIQTRLFMEMQSELVGKLLTADYQFYLENNLGTLNNIIMQQIRKVSQSFKFFAVLITNGVIALAFTVLALTEDFKIVLAMFALGLPLGLLIPYLNRKVEQFSIRGVNEFSSLNGILMQILSNFKYLKSTFTYPLVLKKHQRHNKNIAQITRAQALIGALNEHGSLAYAVTISLLAIYWQSIIKGIALTETLFALGLLYYASRKLLIIPATYQKFLSFAGSILVCNELKGKITETQEELNEEHGTKPDFHGALEFKDVSFVYKSGNKDVLRNISFRVEPNSAVALVGESGSGKSTIVNLLTGLLSPSSGEIVLGNDNYDNLSIPKLRAGLGYVTQEPVIFNDSARDNIRLWDESVKQDEVEKIAAKAHADEFIKDFPERYDSILGDNGLNISGGQRQRITIARELLRETRILLLDEATSSLDTKTEKRIQQGIDELKGERTLIIIAHRLATIRNCDQILVLDKGEIVERGTYDQLHKKNGLFRKMADNQNLNSQ